MDEAQLRSFLQTVNSSRYPDLKQLGERYYLEVFEGIPQDLNLTASDVRSVKSRGKSQNPTRKQSKFITEGLEMLMQSNISETESKFVNPDLGEIPIDCSDKGDLVTSLVYLDRGHKETEHQQVVQKTASSKKKNRKLSCFEFRLTSPFANVVNTDNSDISNCMTKYSMMKQNQVPKKKKLSAINKTITRLYTTHSIKIKSPNPAPPKPADHSMRREQPPRKWKLSTQSVGEGLGEPPRNTLTSTCRSISSISQGTEEI